MSADFPNEAARCQRFLSGRAQSSFEARDENGLAATRLPNSFPLPLAYQSSGRRTLHPNSMALLSDAKYAK
jgi:hypothetical protein